MTTSRQTLEDILRFYAIAGADDALDEIAQDRFVSSSAAPTQSAAVETGESQRQTATRQQAASTHRPFPTASIPDQAQAAHARELARKAASLDELREIMAGFDGCNLKFTAKNLVFADGNPAGRVMFVGEAPGREEDLEGLPFVGRSGQLLDKMIAAIGLDRKVSAYVANVIPWRPPGNRTPTPHETEICRPFIERQIELANPAVLVTLGGPAAKVVVNATEGILKLRGNWRVHTTAAGTAIPAMPTLHPAYLLRNPGHKRFAWRDFLEVKAKLRETVG